MMTKILSELSKTTWAAYVFYPLALMGTLLYIVAEVQGAFGPLGAAYPWYLAMLIAGCVLWERMKPLRQEWSMTARSFLIRDLPMLIVNGATTAGTIWVVTALAQASPALPWVRVGSPWWLQALAALVVSDFLNYWLHRYSHEGKGLVARFLWRSHSLHHLPEGVYVMMHVAAHPFNAAMVRVILILPAIALGLSPEAVFAASVLGGFQGLVSHFNVDSRAGVFNRILVGTELHRLHHSADLAQAKNYAAFFSVWDQLFGTYVPAQSVIERLGVTDRNEYPADRQWLQLLLLPFKTK